MGHPADLKIGHYTRKKTKEKAGGVKPPLQGTFKFVIRGWVGEIF
jgi:hypothetical protein